MDRDRVARAPELKRIVVAIDPAVSTNEGSDETGIIVAGIDVDSFRWPCYFADCGLKRHPMGMGGRRGRRIRVRAKLESVKLEYLHADLGKTSSSIPPFTGFVFSDVQFSHHLT